MSIADQLAKAERVVQCAQREVEVAAEAVLLAASEAIADGWEADQGAGKLRTDLRALTFLRLRLSGWVLGLAQPPAGYQGAPIDGRRN